MRIRCESKKTKKSEGLKPIGKRVKVPFKTGSPVGGVVNISLADAPARSSDIAGLHDVDCGPLRGVIRDYLGDKAFYCHIEPVDVGRHYWDVVDAVKKAAQVLSDSINAAPEKSEAGYPRASNVKVELDKAGDDKAILTYPNPSSAEKALENMQDYCDRDGEVELLTGLQLNDKVIVYTDGEEIKSFLSHFVNVPL